MDLNELLGEELAAQVKEQIGDKELIVNDGSYIPRDKFNEKNNEAKELKKQLDERDKQLEDLQKKAEGNEELSEQVKQYKEENEKLQQEYEQKLEQQAFEHRLDEAIGEYKPKNKKAVKALLDTDSIKLDGDKLLGFEDQMKEVRENETYLFEEETKTGAGANPPAGGSKGPDLDEQYQEAIRKGDMATAFRLKEAAQQEKK